MGLQDIAAAVGTPCYVYDAGLIRTAYATLDEAFEGYPHAIHYALKANSALAVVRLMRALGAHADANSLGEVDVATRCGFRYDQIVFTGVGKSAAEIDRAVSLGLLAINVESPGELDRIDQRAVAQGTVARVALRVNPDIDARSHPHISTGLKSNKFGVPIDEAPALFREMARRKGLQPVGAHVHIGSQITTLEPLTRAAEAVVALAQSLRAEGIALQHLDMGGGLGISYDGGPVVNPADYVRALVTATRDSALKIAIEPGRVLVGPAGVLLTTVVDVKQFPGAKRFVVVDAGMTELMRPALYNAFHRIEPVVPRAGEPGPVDVVGPICESGDCFAKQRPLQEIGEGEYIAFMSAGAYGFSMASRYNTRNLACEVLVKGASFELINARETFEQQIANEKIPAFLK